MGVENEVKLFYPKEHNFGIPLFQNIFNRYVKQHNRDKTGYNIIFILKIYWGKICIARADSIVEGAY